MNRSYGTKLPTRSTMATHEMSLRDRCRSKLAKPVFADQYNSNPANGAFILVDEATNNTVAVRFVR